MDRPAGVAWGPETAEEAGKAADLTMEKNYATSG
jgi:hypothetical protein